MSRNKQWKILLCCTLDTFKKLVCLQIKQHSQYKLHFIHFYNRFKEHWPKQEAQLLCAQLILRHIGTPIR